MATGQHLAQHATHANALFLSFQSISKRLGVRAQRLQHFKRPWLIPDQVHLLLSDSHGPFSLRFSPSPGAPRQTLGRRSRSRRAARLRAVCWLAQAASARWLESIYFNVFQLFQFVFIYFQSFSIHFFGFHVDFRPKRGSEWLRETMARCSCRSKP